MNSPLLAANPARPRLICRFARFQAALAYSSENAHVRGCTACRDYFAAIERLEGQLHREVTTVRQVVSPPNFAESVIRTVREETRDRVRRGSAASRRGLAIGGLAVAAAVAVLLTLQFSSRPNHTAAAEASSTEGAELIVSAVQSLSTGLVDAVIPSAGELVATNPLQQELGSVYSDVRSALDFLALNFLPTATVPPASQPSRQI